MVGRANVWLAMQAAYRGVPTGPREDRGLATSLIAKSAGHGAVAALPFDS